jgi:hypothetical protein
MLFHPMQGLLAAKRRRTLLDEAADHDRAKQAPSAMRTPTMLCDGSAVVIRPVHPTDAVG